MQANQQLLEFAKQMRRTPTDAERRLWRHLRAGRLQEYKFKRQQPLGNYIVDFICFEQRLIIEVDGGQHADRVTEDEMRTLCLQAQDYRVLRFWNDDVLRDTAIVLDAIFSALNAADY